MKKIILLFFLISYSILNAQNHKLEGPIWLKSGRDNIQVYQTEDNSWLYSEWLDNSNIRRAYMGLDNNLSSFVLGLENSTDKFSIIGGNVGIGTSDPAHTLDVNGTVQAKVFDFIDQNLGINGDRVRIFRDDVQYDKAILKVQIGDERHGEVQLGYTSYVNGDWYKSMAFYGNGTAIFSGSVRAPEVRVRIDPWADFVFDKDYELMPLEAVEKFINKNKHLPEIPTAKQVKKDGINLGEMNAKLLQKIEELTLHLIELNKKNKQLAEEISQIRKNQN
ncbi:hypothetical protein [Aquimarina sp. AU119]|uniref:hypothetical protein n=1 Tax=Aquimarina sp. AU119 TaxID=2108528 RepID=UPI000D692C90|nr:hypothetical protein [Aquimarina sp. AU119]